MLHLLTTGLCLLSQLRRRQDSFTAHGHTHHARGERRQRGQYAFPVFIGQHADQQGGALAGKFLLQHIRQGLGAGGIVGGIDHYLLTAQGVTLRTGSPVDLS